MRVGGREEERVTAVLHLGYNPMRTVRECAGRGTGCQKHPYYAKSRLLQDDRGRRGASYRATKFSRCMRAPPPSFSRDVV